MSNDLQSPFGKKTLVSDNLVRSETKDSKVLLLASKNINLFSPYKEPNKVEQFDENKPKSQSNSNHKKRYTELKNEKEDKNSLKNDLSFLNSLLVLYREGEAWHDSFIKYIEGKNCIIIIDSIPKSCNHEGDLLLCQTQFWILHIGLQIEKVFQKNNLLRVINLFNECLKYELSNYDLIYLYFKQVISKFSKSLILTHLSLNDKFKSKCPSSAEEIESDHFIFLLDKPEFMLEGQLNQSFQLKNIPNIRTNKRFSMTEQKSSSPFKIGSFQASSSKKKDMRKQYINRRSRGKESFLIDTRQRGQMFSINSRKSIFSAEKDQNKSSNNKNLTLKKNIPVKKNKNSYSHMDIATNILSFYGRSNIFVNINDKSNEILSKRIGKFKDNILNYFTFSIKNKIHNKIPNENKIVFPNETINQDHDIVNVNDTNENQCLECSSNKIEDNELNIKNINNIDKDLINKSAQDVQEEMNFSFTKENYTNDISSVSYSNTQTPANTPLKNEKNDINSQKKFDQSTDTYDLNYKIDQTTDTHDLFGKIDHTTDTQDLLRMTRLPYQSNIFVKEKINLNYHNEINEDLHFKEMISGKFNRNNESYNHNKKLKSNEIINKENISENEMNRENNKTSFLNYIINEDIERDNKKFEMKKKKDENQII